MSTRRTRAKSGSERFRRVKAASLTERMHPLRVRRLGIAERNDSIDRNDLFIRLPQPVQVVFTLDRRPFPFDLGAVALMGVTPWPYSWTKSRKRCDTGEKYFCFR